MNLEIRVNSTESENKGKYDQLTIGYTDLNSGKDFTYKLMSFVNKEAYTLLKDAKSGDEFLVDTNKNDKGYWTWGNVSVLGSQVVTAKTPNKTPKSTYETPEERAQKQIYIVRQSSLTSAIAMLAAANDKKTAINPDTVIYVAKQFEQYVFGVYQDVGTCEELPTISDEE